MEHRCSRSITRNIPRSLCWGGEQNRGESFCVIIETGGRHVCNGESAFRFVHYEKHTTMKDALRKKVAEHDVPGARAIIIRLITDSAGKRSSLESVAYAIEKLPDLFDEDNGSMRGITVADNSPVLRETMHTELENNFSREKLSLYADLCVSAEMDRREHCTETGADGEAEAEAYEVNAIETSIAEADNTGDVEEPTAPEPVAETRRKGSLAGWIILGIGVVLSIVGLCISFKLLMGIGIGVLMVGSMTLYLDIQKRQYR